MEGGWGKGGEAEEGGSENGDNYVKWEEIV